MAWYVLRVSVHWFCSGQWRGMAVVSFADYSYGKERHLVRKVPACLVSVLLYDTGKCQPRDATIQSSSL